MPLRGKNKLGRRPRNGTFTPKGSFNVSDGTPSSLCGNLPREVLHEARKRWSRCSLVPRAFPSLGMETLWERGCRDGDFSRCWESVKREENSQHWVIFCANKKNWSQNRYIIFTTRFIQSRLKLIYSYGRRLMPSHRFPQLKKLNLNCLTVLLFCYPCESSPSLKMISSPYSVT